MTDNGVRVWRAMGAMSPMGGYVSAPNPTPDEFVTRLLDGAHALVLGGAHLPELPDNRVYRVTVQVAPGGYASQPHPDRPSIADDTSDTRTTTGE